MCGFHSPGGSLHTAGNMRDWQLVLWLYDHHCSSVPRKSAGLIFCNGPKLNIGKVYPSLAHGASLCASVWSALIVRLGDPRGNYQIKTDLIPDEHKQWWPPPMHSLLSWPSLGTSHSLTSTNSCPPYHFQSFHIPVLLNFDFSHSDHSLLSIQHNDLTEIPVLSSNTPTFWEVPPRLSSHPVQSPGKHRFL